MIYLQGHKQLQKRYLFILYQTEFLFKLYYEDVRIQTNLEKLRITIVNLIYQIQGHKNSVQQN